ncbi:uncharacterized protein MONOS_8642 [Monocercomonoides exilis]|uniref:uncharacterized protein n=1 Tax=Monocercomonoides exilis TaxID=2049356 RepID=UPI003559E7D4|nr:hypothetical protein MONOS_8642 [Monocercomonoides exilis]|eukprot:MONOS_8642.1-p1 / transcript=MONOS_8642.1 / gene=MONOS_8642 / organism=Monocercomonoides_exilis_PA203 / gene_product=unspecified product / transcript_product=unspecified product / location=Mono_scaffold00331:5253-5921(+) / protein_length=191 / sequence_SO=supercontig / SO=protein_coding / is_pseudo=false
MHSIDLSDVLEVEAPLKTAEATADDSSRSRWVLVNQKKSLLRAMKMPWGYVVMRREVLLGDVACAHDVDLSEMTSVLLVAPLPSHAVLVNTVFEILGCEAGRGSNVEKGCSVRSGGDCGEGAGSGGAEDGRCGSAACSDCACNIGGAKGGRGRKEGGEEDDEEKEEEEEEEEEVENAKEVSNKTVDYDRD